MVPFEAEKFRPFMDSTIRPWLDEHVEGSQFPGYDGKMIQYYCAENPSPKGIIVMLHGFCGFFGKYHEVMYNFYEHGYSVYFMEHRGHGLSYRPVKDPSMVDITSFDEYVEDVKCFINVGGNDASFGDSSVMVHTDGGILTELSEKDNSTGLVQLFLKDGIPVIHLLNIKSLAADYGLPIDPVPLPEPGEGGVYSEVRYRKEIAVIGLALAAALLWLSRENRQKSAAHG